MKTCDVERLPADTYSHINHGSLSCSWIDHCAVSEALYSSLSDCEINTDFSTSDHSALTITFSVSYLPSLITAHEPSDSILWDFQNKEKRHKFYTLLDTQLSLMPTCSLSQGCIVRDCGRPTHTAC